ncbi:hypothetical protein JOM56_009598 [Amanita muscaria]
MDSLPTGLFKILKGYSSLSPPKSLTIPSNLLLIDLHGFFLNLLLDPHLQQYPPSEQYQKFFWKWAIHCLEELFSGNETEEIDSRLYEYYLSLTLSHDQPIGSSVTPLQSYLTYYWIPSSDEVSLINLDQLTRVTLLESRTTIESGTTGLRTWKASFVLADYLLNRPGLVQGKSVLELGSGVGFLGTMVAAIQQSNMLPGTNLCLTDVNEQVLSRCSSNVKLPCSNLSSLHPHLQCRALDWSLSVKATPSNPRLHFLVTESSPDVILGADIVFDPSLVPALVGMLKLCLSTTKSDHTKMAFIALTARNCSTLTLFIESVKGANLWVEELQLYCQHTSFVDSFSVDSDEHVKIFQITTQRRGRSSSIIVP